MADIVLQRNVASLVTSRRLSPAGTGAQTAGATSQVVGATIDRFAIDHPLSAEIAVLFDTTLASTHTLGFQIVVQSSPDGSTWSTYAAGILPASINGTASGGSTGYTATTGTAPTPATIPAAVGNVGGTAQQGECSIGVDLLGAQRYVRVEVTPEFSASSTDTVTFVVSGVFAGSDRLPATV